MLLKLSFMLLVPHSLRKAPSCPVDVTTERCLLAEVRTHLSTRLNVPQDQLEEAVQTIEDYARSINAGALSQDVLNDILEDMASLRRPGNFQCLAV